MMKLYRDKAAKMRACCVRWDEGMGRDVVLEAPSNGGVNWYSGSSSGSVGDTVYTGLGDVGGIGGVGGVGGVGRNKAYRNKGSRKARRLHAAEIGVMGKGPVSATSVIATIMDTC